MAKTKKKTAPVKFEPLRLPGKHKGNISLRVIRAAVRAVRDERLKREAELANNQ